MSSDATGSNVEIVVRDTLGYAVALTSRLNPSCRDGEEHFVIETRLLRSLAEQSLLLKIPLGDAEISLDPGLLLDYLAQIALPGNGDEQAIAHDREFITRCLVCDMQFESARESESHFQSEDHELAQVSRRRNRERFSSHTIADFVLIEYDRGIERVAIAASEQVR
jgi:hypothetical protein